MANAFLPDSDKLSHLNFSAHSSSLNPVSTKPSPTAGGRLPDLDYLFSFSISKEAPLFSGAPSNSYEGFASFSPPTIRIRARQALPLTKGIPLFPAIPFVPRPACFLLLRRVSLLSASHSRICPRQALPLTKGQLPFRLPQPYPRPPRLSDATTKRKSRAFRPASPPNSVLSFTAPAPAQ